MCVRVYVFVYVCVCVCVCARAPRESVREFVLAALSQSTSTTATTNTACHRVCTVSLTRGKPRLAMSAWSVSIAACASLWRFSIRRFFASYALTVYTQTITNMDGATCEGGRSVSCRRRRPLTYFHVGRVIFGCLLLLRQRHDDMARTQCRRRRFDLRRRQGRRRLRRHLSLLLRWRGTRWRR